MEELDEEEDEVDEDEVLAMAKYKEETGKDAITTMGSVRKEFLKWRKKNWD